MMELKKDDIMTLRKITYISETIRGSYMLLGVRIDHYRLIRGLSCISGWLNESAIL